jgi:hypothetical protein
MRAKKRAAVEPTPTSQAATPPRGRDAVIPGIGYETYERHKHPERATRRLAVAARRRAGRDVIGRRRTDGRFHHGNSGPAEDLRGRRVPSRLLRSVKASDAALVHVHAMREPDQDQKLPRAPSQRRLSHRRNSRGYFGFHRRKRHRLTVAPIPVLSNHQTFTIRR